MTQITPDAQRHLVRERRDRGLDDSHVVRFVESERQIRFTFAAAAESTDREVADGPVRVLVAPEVAKRIEDTVVDTVQRDGKEILVIQPATASPPR